MTTNLWALTRAGELDPQNFGILDDTRLRVPATVMPMINGEAVAAVVEVD